MKKILALALVLCFLLLAACGSASPAENASEPAETANIIEVDSSDTAVDTSAPSQSPEPSEEPEPSAEPEEDGQNPVMNFVGPYVCGGCNVFIEADGGKNGIASITWMQESGQLAEWSITGPFDTETLSISYTDAVKTVHSFGSDGLITSTETVYTDGTGTIAFTEDGMLSWMDDAEHVADGMLFAFMNSNMEQWDLS